MKGIPSPASLVFTPVQPDTLSLKCLRCDAKMTPGHQCEDLDGASAVNSPGTAVGTKGLPPMKGLYAEKSELSGETPPLSLSSETLCPKTVKCHVCACLGRETSLVLCGSVCPSCGVIAAELYYTWCPE